MPKTAECESDQTNAKDPSRAESVGQGAGRQWQRSSVKQLQRRKSKRSDVCRGGDEDGAEPRRLRVLIEHLLAAPPEPGRMIARRRGRYQSNPKQTTQTKERRPRAAPGSVGWSEMVRVTGLEPVSL